jgi:uncharacterized SAM-binding protein YcdF (DUF218 family)
MTAPTMPATMKSAGGGRWIAALRRVLVLLAVLVALGAAAWFARAPLLTGVADAWIVSDPPGPADAVAIFGGGIDTRPFAAAEYYKQGLVAKIILSDVGSNPAEQIGVLSAQADIERAILLKLGVPAAAIETFGHKLTNTYEEAVALRDWAAQTGARSVIVPTENFSARRVRWVLRHVLPADIAVRVPAIDRRDYRRDDWWKSEKGVVAFQNELIKQMYYRLKY